MKTLTKLYEGFPKLKTAIILAVAFLYIVLCVYGGASLLGLLWFACALAVWLVLPGLLLARLLKAGQVLPGFTGPLAILLGTGFLAVLYCFSMRLGILWLLYALPPVMSVAFIVLKFLELRRTPAGGFPFEKPDAPQWMLILLFAALLLLYTFTSVVKNAHPAAVGDMLLNHDMLWNVGNANSFKLAFPPQDIRFYDVRLHYHYLTELICGALSIVSGLPAYDIIGFYLQPWTLGAMVLCLYRLARMLWPKSTLKSLLFPFSLFLFSCASLWKVLPNGLSVFWNSNITHMVTNINSQTTAVIFLSIFCALFFAAGKKDYHTGPAHILLLLGAFILLCFSKGPLAALVTIAAALTLLVGLLQRRGGLRALLLAVVLGVLFLFIYITMFSSGANNSTVFSSYRTLELGYFGNILQALWVTSPTLNKIAIPVLWVVQSVLMVPAAFPLWLRALWRDIRGFFKLDAMHLMAHAMAIGGLAAYFLFAHPHMSQTYFLYAAVFFMHLLAVDSVDTLRWPRKENTAQKHKGVQRAYVVVAAFCAAVGLVTTAFLYVNFVGSGARQLARNLGIIEKYPYDMVMTADDEAAALWLRDNSEKDAMFATNRIHTGGRKEGISNLYSAFAERQGFMEGFQYAVTNMGVPEDEVQRRIAINDALFSAETPPEEIRALCAADGIDYLIFSLQEEGADSQLQGFELVFDSPTVRIYRIV